MASRESLIESHTEECESDDTILMSQVMSTSYLFLNYILLLPQDMSGINKEFLKGQIF